MLSDRCLPVLFVTLVYCGQTAGWIKMPLGTEVGVSPVHIVLDWDPSPPCTERGTATPPHTHFSTLFALAWSPISAAAEHLCI